MDVLLELDGSDMVLLLPLAITVELLNAMHAGGSTEVELALVAINVVNCLPWVDNFQNTHHLHPIPPPNS
jgi:hypothetical protein